MKLLPKTKKKIKKTAKKKEQEKSIFVPNNGGQIEFFKNVPLDSAPTSPYRWYYCRGGLGCVEGNTLIDTDKGKIPIKDLTNKLVRVKTLNGYRLATPSFVKGIDRLYRIKTQSGKEILATADHQFLAPNHQWIKLRHLSVDNKIGVNGTDHVSVSSENTKGFEDDCLKDCHHDDGLPPLLLNVSPNKQQRQYKLFSIQHSFFLYFLCYKKNLLSYCTTKQVPQGVLFWDKIVSIEYVKTDKFYDIHVPIENHYLAQGIWHHNSGKSTLGAAFIVSRSLLDPESRGLITANTYGQLEVSTLVALAEYCDRYGHKLQPAGETPDLTARKIAHNRYCIINGRYHCLVLSAEVFTGRTSNSTQSGRGLQIRSIWADEYSYSASDGSAFRTLNTRLGRGDGWLPGTGVITSSINVNNPYNFMYEMFDDPDRAEELKRIHHTIALSTSENIAHLGADYEASLRASLTPELIKIELEGEYARVIEGVIFAYFNRELHCIDNYQVDERYPIHVSLDFNHHPSCAIAAQFLEHSQEIVVLREWYLEHSDTFKLSDAIALWFLEIRGNRVRSNINTWLEWNCYELQIHGDASGNQKTANSKKTNWQIVKSAFDNLGIEYQTHYKKANPSIKDTINSVNCAFKGEKLWIDRKCKELIKDLESLKWDDNGGINKKDIKRSHEGDCLRYLVEDILPYNKLISGARETRLNYKPSGVIF